MTVVSQDMLNTIASCFPSVNGDQKVTQLEMFMLNSYLTVPIVKSTNGNLLFFVSIVCFIDANVSPQMLLE